MIDTVAGIPITEEFVQNYFKHLVNSFFKILPIREKGVKTLPIYIQSLQAELLGAKSLIYELDNNANFLTLLSILQYLHDNPDSPVSDVRREVFKAISLCNKLESQYAEVEQ